MDTEHDPLDAAELSVDHRPVLQAFADVAHTMGDAELVQLRPREAIVQQWEGNFEIEKGKDRASPKGTSPDRCNPTKGVQARHVAEHLRPNHKPSLGWGSPKPVGPPPCRRRPQQVLNPNCYGGQRAGGTRLSRDFLRITCFLHPKRPPRRSQAPPALPPPRIGCRSRQGQGRTASPA